MALRALVQRVIRIRKLVAPQQKGHGTTPNTKSTSNKSSDANANANANANASASDSVFRSFISSEPGARFAPEKDRYVLYVSPVCPWAHRTTIVRKMKGLESIIPMHLLSMSIGPEGWYFSGQDGSPEQDPLYGHKLLRDFYRKADPGYAGRVTVPILWDTKEETIVNNESSEIIRIFYSAFDELLPEEMREENRPGGGFYPEDKREEIDELDELIFSVNSGVYKVGFATTQEGYDANVFPLFASLDKIEDRLSKATKEKPYLLGEHVTEADVRLFPTIVRFDLAYVPVFLCARKTARHDYPHIYRWLRRLYWDVDQDGNLRAAFHETSEPWLGRFAAGYAKGRVMKVTGGPVIVPVAPAVLIDELGEDE